MLFFVTIKGFLITLKIIFSKPFQKINVIVLTEHIGDIIACEPVCRFLKESDPFCYNIWLVKKRYHDLVKDNRFIDRIICLNSLSDWIMAKHLLRFISYVNIVDLHIHGKVCTHYKMILSNPNKFGITLDNYFSFGPILTSFTKAAGIKCLNDAPLLQMPMRQPEIFLPQKYVVIHTTSNEKCKEWDIESWKIINNYLINELGFFVVEIGLKRTINIDSDKYLDLTGRVSFQEIAYLISNSSIFMGIDSGFAHFANALKKKSVVLLGAYRHFTKYNPYTGFFFDNESNYLVYGSSRVHLIPIDVVKERLDQIIFDLPTLSDY